MDNNVVKFYPADAAKDPDNVLEQAIGSYESLIILGYDKEGRFDPRATSTMTEGTIIWILEYFKMKLLRGDYDGADI